MLLWAGLGIGKVCSGRLCRGLSRGERSDQRLEESFERREALLGVLFALTEQFEIELVEVLLQSEQVCLQTNPLPAEIGL